MQEVLADRGFEENKICCVCVKREHNKLHKATDNFIKINSKYQPVRNLLFELNLIHYQVKSKEDEINMLLCELCQNRIVDFYIFQLKAKRAQELCNPLEHSCHDLKDIETSDDEEPLVLHTLDIVKNFIDNFSVRSIYEDEDEHRLIIERHASSSCLKQEDEENVEKSSDESKGESEFFLVKEDASEDNNDDVNALEDSMEMDPEEFDRIEEQVEAEDETEVLRVVMAPTESFVLRNVEFVERTPEYMINAYKPSNPNRPKNPESWIRNKQKNARSRGESYTTNTGKVIPAKRMRSPCKETCRYKCRTKISETDRQKNFDKYWELASFILQRKFIFEHHKTVPVQRRRFRTESGGKPREYSSHYFLDAEKNGSVQQVHVCESMFLKTFDICRNIVSYLHKKVVTGKVQDMRGINPRKLSLGHQVAIEQIKENPFYHIEQPMPITKMFELYEQHCYEKGIEPVKNHTYRKLFTEYNECEFLKRDKIICQVCDIYYNANDDEKKLQQAQYNEHIKTNEKCMQRAKSRVRSARKTLRRRELKQGKNLEQKSEEAIEDMIVEEHLSSSYDNEDTQFC